MNDNLPQPKEYDAVLGGNNSFLIYAAVLGGIEGILMGLNYAKNRRERNIILSKINEYNKIESSKNGKTNLVKILKNSVKIRNEWRENNPNIIPNLSRAYLIECSIVGANLKQVNFNEANLTAVKFKQIELKQI